MGEVSLDSVRKTFTGWAPFYNSTQGWILPKRRVARLALNLQPGERVLDLACGTGLNFRHLREGVGERGRIVGVDLTPAMLEVARKVIGANGWMNVEVRETDAAALPFPDASFDKVIMTFALHVIPDRMRAIEEVRRVLVPGGKFVTLEMRTATLFVPARLQQLLGIRAGDMSCREIEEIRGVFEEVEVRNYWRKMIFIVVARKG